MKQKDIRKRIKNEARQFTPDPLDRIKTAARAENLLPHDPEQNSAVYNRGNTAAMAKNKRGIVWLLTVFVAIAVCLALILPFTLHFGIDDPFDFTPPNLSAEDVYGMGAVSSVRLLKSNISANAVKAFSAANAIARTAADKSEGEAKRQAKKFNDYFSALNSFFGDDVVSTSTEANTDSRYPYSTKMTITGKDFAGQTNTYIMYYTETLSGSEDDYDDEDETDEENEEETENEYRLDGIMIIDGAEYYLEGERSEETDKDESETELKIRAYADPSDKTSYVQMEQELSVENGETETEYVYSVYVNGELLEQTAVEFETENKNNKVETEYELEFRSGETKGKYAVEREVKDGVTSIKVKYDIDGDSGSFRIREISDGNGNKQYEYTFDDNEKMVFRIN